MRNSDPAKIEIDEFKTDALNDLLQESPPRQSQSLGAVMMDDLIDFNPFEKENKPVSKEDILD